MATILKVRPDAIPMEMRDRNQWVVWRLEDRDGKATKLPYTNSKTLAKSNDAATWLSFDTAWQTHRSGWGSGIGFVFSSDDPYAGIDLDKCRNPESGTIAQWARDVILEFNSYAEVSPSGTGVKIWVKASMPSGMNGRKQTVEEEQVCDAKPAVEVYDRLRYFAMTGWRLKCSPNVEPRQKQLEDFLGHYFKPDVPAPLPDFNTHGAIVERSRRYLLKVPPAISGSNGHGMTFRAACILVKGFGLDQGDALALMREWNQNCQPPWSERELVHKIQDAAKQPGPDGFMRYVREDRFASVKVPQFKEPERKPEVESALPKLITGPDAVSSYIAKLQEGGHGLVKLGLPQVDYALGGGVSLGEMVVIAGRPSHNKSGAALQIVHNMTADGMPALFISEEMSALALAKRTVQYATDVWQDGWMDRIEDVKRDMEKHFANRAPLYFAESCKTVEAVGELIEKVVAENGVKVVAIDYAQLLLGKGRTEYEQLTHVSKSLRQAANANKIVMIALCQLNRAVEGRENFIPRTTDLRGTGQLEQDADVILFGVWPNKINPSNPIGEYRFYVSKNRNREILVPVVNCRFEPSRARLVNLEQAKSNGNGRSWAE
jgi:archaellum biogenesis ATPase FlaH